MQSLAEGERRDGAFSRAQSSTDREVKWVKGSVGCHRKCARISRELPSIKTGCETQQSGRSLPPACMLIALVPCRQGWCKGRCTASHPSYTHAGAEEAVGPPAWQGPAAITLSSA